MASSPNQPFRIAANGKGRFKSYDATGAVQDPVSGAGCQRPVRIRLRQYCRYPPGLYPYPSLGERDGCARSDCQLHADGDAGRELPPSIFVCLQRVGRRHVHSWLAFGGCRNGIGDGRRHGDSLVCSGLNPDGGSRSSWCSACRTRSLETPSRNNSPGGRDCDANLRCCRNQRLRRIRWIQQATAARNADPERDSQRGCGVSHHRVDAQRAVVTATACEAMLEGHRLAGRR